MRLLDRAERRFGHWAVPNVVLILIIAQLVLYACIIIGQVDYGAMLLVPKGGRAGRRVVAANLFSVGAAFSRHQSVFGALFSLFWYVFG